MRTVMATLLLAGCGLSEALFSEEYTNAYCAHWVDCVDPAVLTFDGIEGTGDCVGLVAPKVVTMGLDCDFKRGKAKDCVRAMQTLTCEGDGTKFLFSPPTVCTEVYPGCDINFDEADADTDTDTDSDTDVDTDTDTDTDTDEGI